MQKTKMHKKEPRVFTPHPQALVAVQTSTARQTARVCARKELHVKLFFQDLVDEYLLISI